MTTTRRLIGLSEDNDRRLLKTVSATDLEGYITHVVGWHVCVFMDDVARSG